MIRPIYMSAAIAVLACCCGAATIAPVQDSVDFSKLPPQPSIMAEKLAALQMPLAGAIKLVADKTGGRASAASIQEKDGKMLYVVDVYTDDGHKRFSVNPADGSVVDEQPIPWLPGDPVEGEWTETDSGLRFYDMVIGDGASPSPASVVKVHYSGWRVDGFLFDSSVERGVPATFPLNRVIPGWTEGVGSMKVGGKRKLIIPADLGYGARGAGADIPPGAMLIFDVELLEIVQ